MNVPWPGVPEEVVDRFVIGITDAFGMGKRGSVIAGRLLLNTLRLQAIDHSGPWRREICRLVEKAILMYEAAYTKDLDLEASDAEGAGPFCMG